MKGWPIIVTGSAAPPAQTWGSQFFELRVIAVAIQPDRPYISSPTSDKQKQLTPSSGNPLDVVLKNNFTTIHARTRFFPASRTASKPWASALRLGEVAANFAKFTRPLCKPALSPFLFVHGERSRIAEKTIDRLSSHLARLGCRFLAALLRRLCTAGKRLSNQPPDCFRPRWARRRLRPDPDVEGFQFVRQHAHIKLLRICIPTSQRHRFVLGRSGSTAEQGSHAELELDWLVRRHRGPARIQGRRGADRRLRSAQTAYRRRQTLQ
jgi:hypothetical protein